MKRIIALFLAALMLVLTLSSCSLAQKTPQDGTGDATPPIDGETNGGGTSSEEDVPRDENGFIIFPEGNYLADPKFDTDEPLPDYDVDDYFVHTGNMFTCGLCSTEDTVYYIVEEHGVGSRMHSLLMYFDKKTGIGGPLCGKPECMHDSSDCNAYFSGYSKGLHIYDGKLYIGSGSSIKRTNLDGTDRESVAGISGDLLITNGTFFTSVPHRGYVYSYSFGSSISDGQEINSVRIAAQPINGGESFSIFMRDYDTDECLDVHCSLKFLGNDVYVLISSSVPANGSEIGHTGVLDIYRWDSKTRQAEAIYHGSLDEDDVSFESSFPDYTIIRGDGIYISKDHEMWDEDGKYVCINSGLCKYSFETGKIEHVMWLGEERGAPQCVFDGRVYSIYYGTMYVHDLNGNQTARAETLPEQRSGAFAGVDDEYYYCLKLTESDGYVAIPKDGGEAIFLK